MLVPTHRLSPYISNLIALPCLTYRLTSLFREEAGRPPSLNCGLGICDKPELRDCRWILTDASVTEVEALPERDRTDDERYRDVLEIVQRTSREIGDPEKRDKLVVEYVCRGCGDADGKTEQGK